MNEAIVLLMLLWAVLLLPGALRSRNSSPHATVGGFSRAMDVLRTKPGQGRELMVPGDAGRIVARGLSRDAAEPSVREAARRRAPAPPAAPAPSDRGEDPVVARRRTWFLRLLAGTGAALLLALGVGGWLWALFTLSVVVTGGYVTLLRRLKLQHDEARRVVRDLELRRSEDQLPDQAPWPAEDASGLALGTVRLRRWEA